MINIFEDYIHKNWNRLFNIKEKPKKISIMKIGGRPGDESALSLVMFINDSKMPSYFLKLNRNPDYTEGVKSEYDNYLKIHSKLNECKASVPNPIFIENINNHVVFCESILFGKKIGGQLFKSRNTTYKKRMTEKYFRLSSEWLKRFHKETFSGYEIFDDEFIRKYVQYPIDNILNKYPDKLAELNDKFYYLKKKIKGFKGSKIPIVAVQGDFNHWNILIDKDHINVVDWEDCEEKGMPFKDLFHLLFDYSTAFYSKQDSKESFKLFFEKNSWTFDLVIKYFKSFSQQFDIEMKLLFAMVPLFSIELILKDYKKHRDPRSIPFNSLSMMKLTLDLFYEIIGK